MPRFTQADEAVLRRTMLPRGADYKYKPEDIEFIKTETGKGKEDIQYWARQFRWKMGINKLPGGLNAEEFLRSSPESSYDKVERIRIKRCYVSMYNANQNLVENFSIPWSRKPGDVPIQFQCFAWNPETLVAEGFMDFNDQVYTTTIHDRLVELGAGSITIVTFENNDDDHSAASGLNQVLTAAESEGFKKVMRGGCNPRLTEKLMELQAEERAKEQAKNTEFDEKTQAAIKMSLGEIKDSMATKEEIFHLEEVTQTKSDEIKTAVDEMNEKIDKNQIALASQALTISDQAVTIKAHEETIAKQLKNIASLNKNIKDQQKNIFSLNENLANNDRKIFNLEKDKKDLKAANESQRYIIAKLNAERDQTARELKEKDQIILRLTRENQRYHSGKEEEHTTILNQYKELMAEFQACKKRKHDE